MDYKNLHTFTLEKIFGSIKNHIIRQNENIRIVHLQDKKGVSRTLGIVKFLNVDSDLLIGVHEKILTGELLGKTLFDSNIDFDKEFIGTFKVKLPKWLMEDFNTEQDSSFAIFSKISIYTNRLSNDKFLYSELIEIIPPELKDVFVDKTKSLYKIDENILSLFKAVDIKVIKLENKL